MTNNNHTHQVRFLFDPICPWAYQASLWIREAAKVRPIQITWGLLSLEFINRDKKDDQYLLPLRRNRSTFRLLEQVRQIGGNQALDKLYLAIGAARHEQNRSLTDQNMLQNALETCGLPNSLLNETRISPELDEQIENSCALAVAQGAFGVPSLYINEIQTPYYGPLIEVVPRDEEAGELWDHVLGLVNLPYFFELKRSRL
jgi:protein-disulfide isomerase-like protein with CxxC motif